MRANLTTWLLISAAIVLLISVGRVDLLAIVAPVSIAISLLATRKVSSGSTGPRRI